MEAIEYVRAFSQEQQERLKAMHENEPLCGMQKEALEYADFLNEKAPQVLLIVDRYLPANKRLPFRDAFARLEAPIASAEADKEREAMRNEGGTPERLMRHHGRRIAMRMRLEELRRWAPLLPPPLVGEIRSVSERAAKD